MTPRLRDSLACPVCGAMLVMRMSAKADKIEAYICGDCDSEYPVVRGIGRFTGARGNYAENFGAQWEFFRTVQIDRLAGHTLSEDRFVNDTGWTKEWMKGKLIFDAGCGAGRFSDVMAQFGAEVVACDLSSAVEACRATSLEPLNAAAERGNVTVLQADLTALPFKPGSFDAIHCAGVIQHTHDPEKVMRGLIRYLKPGGKLFYNFYESSAVSDWQLIKRILRNWTPGWSFERLYAFAQVLCAIFFVPSFLISKVPVLRAFNRFLPICSTHPPGVRLSEQYKLTLLDTIDWYGPVYEIRQNHEAVAVLLRDEGMREVFSDPGRAWGVR